MRCRSSYLSILLTVLCPFAQAQTIDSDIQERAENYLTMNVRIYSQRSECENILLKTRTKVEFMNSFAVQERIRPVQKQMLEICKVRAAVKGSAVEAGLVEKVNLIVDNCSGWGYFGKQLQKRTISHGNSDYVERLYRYTIQCRE